MGSWEHRHGKGSLHKLNRHSSSLPHSRRRHPRSSAHRQPAGSHTAWQNHMHPVLKCFRQFRLVFQTHHVKEKFYHVFSAKDCADRCIRSIACGNSIFRVYGNSNCHLLCFVILNKGSVFQRKAFAGKQKRLEKPPVSKSLSELLNSLPLPGNACADGVWAAASTSSESYLRQRTHQFSCFLIGQCMMRLPRRAPEVLPRFPV